MRATICIPGARLTLAAAEHDAAPGAVSLTIRAAGLDCLTLTPHEAALLAGELERAAWAAQRQVQGATGTQRCPGCDLVNGCPEFCRCKPEAGADRLAGYAAKYEAATAVPA